MNIHNENVVPKAGDKALTNWNKRKKGKAVSGMLPAGKSSIIDPIRKHEFPFTVYARWGSELVRFVSEIHLKKKKKAKSEIIFTCYFFLFICGNI